MSTRRSGLRFVETIAEASTASRTNGDIQAVPARNVRDVETLQAAPRYPCSRANILLVSLSRSEGAVYEPLAGSRQIVHFAREHGRPHDGHALTPCGTTVWHFVHLRTKPIRLMLSDEILHVITHSYLLYVYPYDLVGRYAA